MPPFGWCTSATKSADETAARVKKLGGSHGAAVRCMDNGRWPWSPIRPARISPSGSQRRIKAQRDGGEGHRYLGRISVRPRKVMKFYEDLFAGRWSRKRSEARRNRRRVPNIMLGDAMLGGLQPPEQRDPDAPHFLSTSRWTMWRRRRRGRQRSAASVFVESMDIGESGSSR